jgi:hypothetical protein
MHLPHRNRHDRPASGPARTPLILVGLVGLASLVLVGLAVTRSHSQPAPTASEREAAFHPVSVSPTPTVVTPTPTTTPGERVG